MKELAEDLMGQFCSRGVTSEAEDAEMLRQSVDNLITFSLNKKSLVL